MICSEICTHQFSNAEAGFQKYDAYQKYGGNMAENMVEKQTNNYYKNGENVGIFTILREVSTYILYAKQLYTYLYIGKISQTLNLVWYFDSESKGGLPFLVVQAISAYRDIIYC